MRTVMARLNGLDGEWGVEPLPPASPVPRPLEPLAPLQLSGGDERARLEAAHALIVNHEQVARFAARGASDPGKPAFQADLADPNAEAAEEMVEPVDVCLRVVAAALIEGREAAARSAEQAGMRGLLRRTAELAAEGKAEGGEEGDREAGGREEGGGEDGAEGGAEEGSGGRRWRPPLADGWEEYEDEDGRLYFWNDETGEIALGDSPPTRQLDACLAYLRDRVGVPRDMGAAAAVMLRAHLNWAIGILRES